MRMAALLDFLVNLAKQSGNGFIRKVKVVGPTYIFVITTSRYGIRECTRLITRKK